MKEIKENNMMCTECDGKGYLEDVISEGLPAGDPYLEPHVERCDECKQCMQMMQKQYLQLERR
jgi:hypothetical protein